MERLGDKIKALRECPANALSQDDLATKAGVSQTTIADLERGRNETSRRLVFIAHALGVTGEQLTSLSARALIDIAHKANPSALTTADPHLSRKSPSAATPANPKTRKALLDLVRELDRGDLTPEMQEMLKLEFEAKAKAVKQFWADRKKGQGGND